MRYVYEGPGPLDDGDGGLVHPGDIREFEEEPDWGLWRELRDDEEREHPGTGEQMTGVEHPADGTLSPPVTGTEGGPQPSGLVPVADQRAAGVAPADTVTMADQAAGTPAPATEGA